MDRCKEPGCENVAAIGGRCVKHDTQFVRERQNDPAAQAARVAAAAAVHAAAAQSDLAEAQAEAVRRDAKRKDKQAFAAMDEEQREAVMNREKREADREKLKQVFDRIGDCVACIEQDGAATPAINLSSFPGGHTQGHPATYRYTNLRAARAYLVDVREELNHVIHWEAAMTREQVLTRIETNLTRAKDAMSVQARRARDELGTRHLYIRMWGGFLTLAALVGGIAAVGGGCVGIAIGGPIALYVLLTGLGKLRNPWLSSVEVSLPADWQDILNDAS